MRNKEWEEEKKEEESSRGRGAKMEGCAVLLTEGECVREREGGSKKLSSLRTINLIAKRLN